MLDSFVEDLANNYRQLVSLAFTEHAFYILGSRPTVRIEFRLLSCLGSPPTVRIEFRLLSCLGSRPTVRIEFRLLSCLGSRPTVRIEFRLLSCLGSRPTVRIEFRVLSCFRQGCGFQLPEMSHFALSEHYTNAFDS